jgi:hypothetical protein
VLPAEPERETRIGSHGSLQRAAMRGGGCCVSSVENCPMFQRGRFSARSRQTDPSWLRNRGRNRPRRRGSCLPRPATEPKSPGRLGDDSGRKSCRLRDKMGKQATVRHNRPGPYFGKSHENAFGRPLYGSLPNSDGSAFPENTYSAKSNRSGGLGTWPTSR